MIARIQHMRKERGFTLIELLVVIAIIGLLSSVVLASLNNARIKARDARRLSDLKSIETALELYYGDNNAYPTTASGGTTVTSALASVLKPTYMSDVPKDPSRADTSSTGYLYCSTDAQSYAVLAWLEKNSTYCVVASGSSGNCSWATTYSTCK
jgi:type II secretion system protein G